MRPTRLALSSRSTHPRGAGKRYCGSPCLLQVEALDCRDGAAHAHPRSVAANDRDVRRRTQETPQVVFGLPCGDRPRTPSEGLYRQAEPDRALRRRECMAEPQCGDCRSRHVAVTLAADADIKGVIVDAFWFITAPNPIIVPDRTVSKSILDFIFIICSYLSYFLRK